MMLYYVDSLKITARQDSIRLRHFCRVARLIEHTLAMSAFGFSILSFSHVKASADAASELGVVSGQIPSSSIRSPSCMANSTI